MPCNCARRIPRYVNSPTPIAPVGKRFATTEEISTPFGSRLVSAEQYKKLSQKKPSLK